MNLNYLITNAQNMPNIPKVVQELIESFNNENVNGQEIASKVSQDQSMTAKVLRMANSAKYGGHRQVGSVNEAVVLLGFNALRTLVLASGLTGSIKAPENFDIERFWKKSFCVASLCKWLAGFSIKTDKEVAFTCGMLYDIGGLLTHILAPEEALAIDEGVAQGSERVSLEQDKLGFTHIEAGAELAHRWKFPEEIVDAILKQEGVDDDEHPLADLLFLALYIYDNRDEKPQNLLDNLPETQLERLELDTHKLVEEIDIIYNLESEIAELLG